MGAAYLSADDPVPHAIEAIPSQAQDRCDDYLASSYRPSPTFVVNSTQLTEFLGRGRKNTLLYFTILQPTILFLGAYAHLTLVKVWLAYSQKKEYLSLSISIRN